MVDIGANTIEKHAVSQRDYRIQSFLCSRHAHGHLCKHLGIDSSTDPDDRYSIGTRIYSVNTYINRHVHTEYLKIIEVYSHFGT